MTETEDPNLGPGSFRPNSMKFELLLLLLFFKKKYRNFAFFKKLNNILGRSEDGSARKDVDYETAISNAGFGRFHYWLLFVCGWANASDAVEILCISFVLPAATCDFDLTSEDKG